MTLTSGSYTANLLGTIRSHLAGLQGYDVMALELIQNADDAKAQEITFDITDRGLWVRNSASFTYCGDLAATECRLQHSEGYSCDYHRIVDVASGGKLGQSENIGRFGIGFVSAYQITDHPRIQSSGIELTLKPETGQWDLKPCQDTPGTEFFLPWADDSNTKARQALGVSHVTSAHVEQLAEDLTDVARRSLLFLRHVTKATVRRNGRLLLGCDLDRGDGTDLIVSFRPGNDVEHWHILRADAASTATQLYATHPRLESLRRSTKISIGVRVDPQPLQEGLLYAFLPTEQSTGLPLHINADFFPEPDRKAVIFAGHQHEQAWNEMLVDAAAIELARDVVGLRKTLGDTQFWQVLGGAYELYSRATGHPPIFDHFWDRLKAACAGAPVVRAQTDSLRCPTEIILPRIASFTPKQVKALQELGGHLAIDDLQPYRNALNQLGAQILTLDRFVNFLVNGLSALTAGESQIEPKRLELFYKPLWSVIADLLPDPGTQNPASTVPVQRLRTLPAIVSEDLYCVTIDQSYLAPPALDSSRVAELLPALSIASRAISGVPKLPSLIPALDLGAVVEHLSDLATDNSLSDVISAEPKDLRDLYTLLADLDRVKAADDAVLQALRNLPIWLSSRGLISARRALLPGNFTDPAGVGDLLDTGVLSDRAKDFVCSRLGVATQSIEAFVETVVPTFFGKAGPADVTKYEPLILELANHPNLLNDEKAIRILGSLPIVPTQDGGWSRPAETYRRTDTLVSVLGDATHLWLDTGRTPKARSVQSFIDNLGIRRTPMAQHLVDRMISLADDELPTAEARRASAEAFYVLCDKYESWQTLPFFQQVIGTLQEATCFPAENDQEQWHSPSSLYAPYRPEAFRSQAKILDFKNMARLKRGLLEELGVSTEPETKLVIGHLKHCIEGNEKPADTTYQILNERAIKDKALVETLAETRCVYVDGLGTFVHPNRLFWSAQRLGRFAFTIPQNLNSYRPLFEALRVKDGPEGADFVRIIGEISEDYFLQSRALHGQDRAVFDSCWLALAARYGREELETDDIRGLREAATVVNARDHLVDPDEVLIQDSEWYAGFFDGELESALCKPVPELWPLFEEVGVMRLSERARVALEFTLGDEIEEPDVAAILSERTGTILRLLHDKPDAVRKTVAAGLFDVTAVSYDEVRIQASVQIGDSDAPPQPASPVRAHAFYDRDTHLLSLERPVGDRSWPHVLNALLHQLIPDAAGGEIPKLTLSLRPLMAMPVEEGQRELTDAGVPELEDFLTPEEIEDVTSPEFGGIGTGGPQLNSESDALASRPSSTDPTHNSDKEAGPGSRLEAPDPAQQQSLAPSGESTSAANQDVAAGGASPPERVGPGVARAGAKTSRPKHKVQRDKRLLSYVNHSGVEDTNRDPEGGNEHNLAIEAAARAAVCKFEIARGRTPKQMPLTHPGYDIVSQDTVRGRQRLIEVKGVAGEWNRTGVGLSRLQFTNAQEYPEQFWLYVVEWVSDPPNMRVHPIAKPATQVTSFMFDGNWRAVVEEETIDPVVAFRAGVRIRHLNWGYGRIASVDVRGSMRLLTIDFDESGRRTVTLSVKALSLVEEEDDGDDPA